MIVQVSRPAAPPEAPADRLLERYLQVRRVTEQLCEPLETEDYVIQPMPDASPIKWHLAHATWFFETFVLAAEARGYTPFHPQFAHLFTSYFLPSGSPFVRSSRGLLSRPTVEQVRRYRRHVDERVQRLLGKTVGPVSSRLAAVLELGWNHEQQHQELIVTDVKNLFAQNPMHPAYRKRPERRPATVETRPLEWIEFVGGLHEIGHEGDGFSFDNERPRHQVFLRPFRLANRLVTNGEFMEFMKAGGYRQPRFWLAAGWDAVCRLGWNAPLYWRRFDNAWHVMTLAGLREVDESEPVTHVSYFEADAYARWADARLPGEAEWEIAAAPVTMQGNFLESGRFHPARLNDRGGTNRPGRLCQMFGDCWEWTADQYRPYPGYSPTPGSVGEYGGKLMCNQFVLRGGSCATPITHIRPTYRNFLPPDARWQFSGVRLAKGAEE